MHLTDTEKKWFQDHTRHEVAERYNISLPTVDRWTRKNGVKCKRKPGSGGKGWPLKESKMCPVCETMHKNGKYCSRKCMFESEEHLDMLRNIDRSYTQTEAFSIKQSNPNTPKYKKYVNKVHKLTAKVYDEHKESINPNDYPRTLCGVKDGYQLDHIIPIKFGFENDIPPEIIAEQNNLRMLPWKENLMRNYSEN